MTDRNRLSSLLAEAQARLQKKTQPKWIAPMLATLTDQRFSREGWLLEPTWDGERCLAFRSGRELNLFSRFVIDGYTEPRRRRIYFGALLLGYYRRQTLVYAGKVGDRFRS
jgi:ATP-dependent DNA ligase